MSELLRPLQQTAYLCGMDWLSPFILHAVLDGDYGAIKATDDVAMQGKVEELKAYIDSIDFDSSHSLAPVVTPHYLKKIS